MNSASARTMAFPGTLGAEGHGDPRLPEPLSPRQLRRARLVAHMARRRLAFQALHITLGLLGWAVIGAAIWGISGALR